MQMPKDHEEKLKKDQQNAQAFGDEEFAQPLDEHSVEEIERAQRTGDEEEHGSKKKANKH
ncbi:hypothetical protein [Sporolactobacillus vineae]|uniref:hypothetical protein n=1 Tax=Sporolactobacillus vineae TaxID=444463 RepID=UPI0002FDA4B0|nr:hypothetical protein [Sporolactobacillus vineae]